MTGTFQHHYIPNTEEDRRNMLHTLGVETVEELFADIPEEYRNPPLNIPPPLSELELRREMEALAARNHDSKRYACFLGAGAYNHFSPSAVRTIISRGEFLTAYTPYQPEVSQGTLQAAYEFQTMICNLTGMEVANAGMYDGATSLAEAALMACRVTGRKGIALSSTVSPFYRQVLNTYVQAQGVEVHITDLMTLNGIPDDTACLIVQYPNFFGYLEDFGYIAKAAHDREALFVVSANPMALGLFRPPGDYGADIVTGETQPLGIPMSFGGAYVGFFCTRQKYLRQMPGRIVGRTVDNQGRKGYVLTIQTREQHIRRERATSNICTSQQLIALAATVYMAALGKQSLRQVAELCYHKAHYAASLIDQISGYHFPMSGNFFNEFTVQCPVSPSLINQRLLEHNIIGGLDISQLSPNSMLLCVTEMNTREEIETLVSILGEFSP